MVEDWSEKNRKQGIEFQYEDNKRGSRRRSRSPRRGGDRGSGQTGGGAAQRRELQRQQRKALFGGGRAAPAGGGALSSGGAGGSGAAVAASSSEDESEAPPNSASSGAGMGSSAGDCSANAWESTSLASSSTGGKFLRLMGAKDAKPTANTGIAGGINHRQREREMEQQFWQGMKQARGRGLGG
mmetsp:Transcript_40092/g.101861  ORF Transcript_40092/g.101861 Transcript_40092/m.101861 type:complete len:184 (+) Transcript_40092:50-601(+)